MRRILIVRFGGMGDILMTTPAVRRLHDAWAPCEIDYIVGRNNRDALTGIGYLNNIIVWDPHGEQAKLANFIPFVADLRRRRYDLFINFQPSAKTLAMMLGVGAKRSLVFRKDRRPLPATRRTRHAIDDFSKELQSIGLREVPDRRMDFAVPGDARASLAARLTRLGVPADAPLIVINPGGTREVNRWPPEQYVELLQRLASQMPHARLFLSGGPSDAARAEYIAAHVGPQIALVNLAKQLSLKETGALLERASVFVTPDTGPMHIASALGTPLVCLSGAADPDRTGPLNRQDLVVIRRDLSCVSCGARTCKRGDIACMTGMEVDWVLAAVRRRMGETVPRHLPIEEVGAAGLHPLVRHVPADETHSIVGV